MMTPPHEPARPIRIVLPMIAIAFGVGLLLALATSSGIAEERLSRGAPSVALLANAMATVAALFALVPTMRRALVSHPGMVLVPQILGAAAGIVVVHFALRRSSFGALPWLSERPAQFMNDVVAVSGLLALVWACASGLDARILVIAFIGMTLYRTTAPLWHLDHAPEGYQRSVQDLVVAQFVAAAFALGLFRTAIMRAGLNE